MNDPLIDLQTRLTFQEDAIDHLTRTVADQEGLIRKLQQQMQELYARLQELKTAAADPQAAERPPHY
ncbi:MAG: SlyX family protein [Pseudomonadota bacterium]